MTVIAPCDSIEAKKATLAAAKMEGPVYIRLAREKTPVITTEATPFKIGKAEVYFEPKKGIKSQVGIIACGALVYNALMAAKELEDEGVGVSVLNLATIKPLDKKGVLDFAKKHQALITVEEHQVYGGMGSAVAEFLATAHPTSITFIGVQDQFGQSGTPDELIEHYGMGIASIKKAVKAAIKKK